MRRAAGEYLPQTVGDETYRAYLPAPLPPEPPLELGTALLRQMDEANRALGRLDGVSELWSLFDEDRRRIHDQGRLAGTALRVHDLLQQRPILSIPVACKALNLTHPPVSKSMRRLEEMGIVRELTGRKRNRLYVYDAYLKVSSEGTEIPA